MPKGPDITRKQIAEMRRSRELAIEANHGAEYATHGLPPEAASSFRMWLSHGGEILDMAEECLASRERAGE